MHFENTFFTNGNILPAIPKRMHKDSPVNVFMHLLVARTAVASIFGEAVFGVVNHFILSFILRIARMRFCSPLVKPNCWRYFRAFFQDLGIFKIIDG